MKKKMKYQKKKKRFLGVESNNQNWAFLKPINKHVTETDLSYHLPLYSQQNHHPPPFPWPGIIFML